MPTVAYKFFVPVSSNHVWHRFKHSSLPWIDVPACSDRIVESPPDLAVIGPLGSCLAIRIVCFIFITVCARRGVGRTESARTTKSAKLLARPTSTLNLPPTQSSQNTHLRPFRAPCSRPAHMSNDGSMDSSLSIYSTSIVIIWLEIGLHGRTAI